MISKVALLERLAHVASPKSRISSSNRALLFCREYMVVEDGIIFSRSYIDFGGRSDEKFS